MFSNHFSLNNYDFFENFNLFLVVINVNYFSRALYLMHCAVLYFEKIWINISHSKQMKSIVQQFQQFHRLFLFNQSSKWTWKMCIKNAFFYSLLHRSGFSSNSFLVLGNGRAIHLYSSISNFSLKSVTVDILYVK